MAVARDLAARAVGVAMVVVVEDSAAAARAAVGEWVAGAAVVGRGGWRRWRWWGAWRNRRPCDEDRDGILGRLLLKSIGRPIGGHVHGSQDQYQRGPWVYGRGGFCKPAGAFGRRAVVVDESHAPCAGLGVERLFRPSSGPMRARLSDSASERRKE